MEVEKCSLEGLFKIKSTLIEDNRGFFREHYRASALKEAIGRAPLFNQGNHSRSNKGVLRGFHCEPWDKLVYVVRGTALCVVADTRPESQTFGSVESFLMGDEPGSHFRLFISEGLSNAFYCYTDVDYVNDVSAEFCPENRKGVIWNDPTLKVVWPTTSPVVSEWDAGLPTLK